SLPGAPGRSPRCFPRLRRRRSARRLVPGGSRTDASGSYTSAVATAASKPVILAVDDDAPVLRAVERDLRSRYGKEYRIVAATSGAEALEAVRQLTVRGGAIGLFVVDQRMPGMTGIEFLAQAIELQPDAKRVLLTAYADTDVAIKAI